MHPSDSFSELERLYTTGAAAFSTPYRLFKAARKKGLRTTLEKVNSFFDSFPTSSRFRRKYKKNARNTRVIIGGPDQVLQADLCFFTPFNKYIGCLVVIDCFSRKTWAKPFKTKQSKEIAGIFATFLAEQEMTPRILNTDLGMIV